MFVIVFQYLNETAMKSELSETHADIIATRIYSF